MGKKLNIHLGSEGGEAETLVLDCPMFKEKIMIKKAIKIMESKNTGRYEIKKIVSVKK